MSRNKREGRYLGWVKGRHIRCEYTYNVGCWWAFRVWNDRRHHGRY